MRIFLTGATGVVGKRVIPLLAAAGHHVTALGRTPAKRDRIIELGGTPILVDLFDPSALRRAIAGHQVVINLATSIPPVSRAFLPGAWRENDHIRRVGSGNLAGAAIDAGVERFIQESFAPIYPDRGDQWIDERTPAEPARYNRSVLVAEAAADRFGWSGGVGVVLRFAYFYGPDSDFTLLTIRAVRRGWAPALGPADGFISSLSHDDAAGAVVAALTLPGGIYNASDDEPVPRREFYDSLAAAMGLGPPRFPPPWLARITGSIGEMLARSQRISNRKLRDASGWRPAVPGVKEGWRNVWTAVAETFPPAR